MRRLVSVAAVVPTLVFGTAVSAAAQEDHEHMYFAGNARDCRDIDVAGDTLYSSEEPVPGQDEIIQGTIHGDENEFVDVELLDDSYVITAVVVKGGPNYAVYLEPPWTDLHAPPLGWQPGEPEPVPPKYPAISHWFVCGEKNGTESPTPTPTDTPTDTPTETPVPTETPAPSESPETAVPNGNGQGLPDTGASPALLIALGLTLIGGAALAFRARVTSSS